MTYLISMICSIIKSSAESSTLALFEITLKKAADVKSHIGDPLARDFLFVSKSIQSDNGFKPSTRVLSTAASRSSSQRTPLRS